MADGPSIKFPDGNVDIVDPDDIAPTYADIITELREVDGVVYLSLGSVIIDGEGDAGRKVRVVTRLRISRPRADVIYGLLGNMLGGTRPKEPVN